MNPQYERLAEVAMEAVELFDNRIDCTCADESGWCWYRLTPDEKTAERRRFVAEAIEYELDEV